MNLKFKLTIIAVLLLNFTIIAQSSYLLKGTVVSSADNSPIPGASVVIKDSAKGTTTDFDGIFTLEVKQGDVLQVSFMGFGTQLVTITNQRDLTISLNEEQNLLDEVVVIGYGTSKKSHLTGAISKVVNEDLDQVAVSRVDDALVGQVSGVNIQATEGEAGSAPTIRIRGTGSITGDSSPLVVVDGVVVDADFLGALDMSDVESFEVLKDAASGAIYGSRGGNGVIMITTKSGRSGETKFSYSTYLGYKTARQSDAYYSTLAETAAAEMEYNGFLSDKTLLKQLLNTDTNWQEIIFDGGWINNHSFSARGGNDETKFSLAANYLKDEGVLLTDEYDKYSIKAKISHEFTDKFSMGLSITPSHTKRRRFDGSAHDILRQPSWLPVYVNEDNIQFVNRVRDGGKYANVQIGDYAIQRMFDDYDLVNGVPVTSGTDISNTSNTNPAAKVLERKYMYYKYKVLGSLYAKYKINDDLTFRTSLAGDTQYERRSRYQGVEAHRNGASNSQLDSTTIRRYHWAIDNVLSYNKTIDKHDISAVIGTSAEKNRYEYSTIRGSQYENDNNRIIAAAAEVSDLTGYEYVNTLLSFFGRVNYAYDDKYLGSVSVRRDGSSVFGPDTKYGNFLAGSLGWNVYKEDFLADSDVVNNLKLRISLGVTGNNSFDTGDDLVDNFPYLALLSNTNTSAVTGGVVTDAVNPLNIANSVLGWERSIEFNPGIDFGFFNNVVSGSIDYYNRASDQLLLDNPVSVTTGFDTALLNIGKVENTGWEVELRTKNFSLDNFKWSTSIIASANKNKLVDFAESNGQIQNVDSKRAAEWINMEGQPISSFYGWVVDRDIPLEYLSNPFHPIGAEAQDVYVKDLNGDGIIDDDDKTILGDPYPEFVWSVTNDFKLGNFDASFMFQGSHGAEVRNMGDQYIFNHFNSAQDFISSTPDQEFIKQKIFTNDIVQDASYIALRNVNIGYTFKEAVTSKLGFSGLRVYASGQNLMYLTADDYTGFNPESIYDTSATTYGYQRAGSPVFSTVSVGFNIDF